MSTPTTRRSVLRGTAAVVATGAGLVGTAGLVGAAGPAAAAARTASSGTGRPTIVLVHGAWADGSSWSTVVSRLQSDGWNVVVPQLHLRGIADDADVVRRAVTAVGGPVVLVGHSYGGAVITAAGSGEAAVKALVYVAAFVPDQGESLGALVGLKPPAPVLTDDVIVADGIGDLTIRRDAFPAYFAPDLAPDKAKVLAAVQGPVSAASFQETLAVTPAWRQLPSWYQVSAYDKVINPDLQRLLVERIGATSVTLNTGHASPVTRPTDVARLIRRAAASVG